MFHKSSTSFILSAMAVADAIMVNTGLLRLWIYFQFDIDVRAMTSFGCKFHVMLTYYIHQVYKTNTLSFSIITEINIVAFKTQLCD